MAGESLLIVGFEGGSSLCELGPASDVAFFFACVGQLAASQGEEDWCMLTDRLYRRYLRLDELALATRMMSKVRDDFSSLPSTYLGVDRLAGGEDAGLAAGLGRDLLGNHVCALFRAL